MKAKVTNIELDKTTREIKVVISAKGSKYVHEPDKHGFPYFINSACLVEGFDYVLEFGHIAIDAMKNNENLMPLIKENRKLKQHILDSDLATRCVQFLSSLDYDKLTDFQAKCVLLLEKELKP